MNVIRKVPAALLVVLFAGLFAKSALAGCGMCGTQKKCRKVCRLECDVREVAIVCWKCECEDIVLGPPCKPGCKECGVACQDCGITKGGTCQKGCQKDCPKCPKGKHFVVKHEKPGCGPKVKTRKKLYRKVCIKRVPHYRWVIDECCKGCSKGSPIIIPEGTVVPGTEDSVPPPPLPGSEDGVPVPPATEAAFQPIDSNTAGSVEVDANLSAAKPLRLPGRLVNFLTK